MRSGRQDAQRKAAALVSMVAILLIVAAFAGVFLNVHAVQLSTEETGIHRLRAQAAAQAATHLTLWELRNNADLQDAMARVVYEGDTSFGADPLFNVTGDLAGATFEVDVWPGVDTVRLKSRGICGGVYYDRWSQMPMGFGKRFGNETVESTTLSDMPNQQIASQVTLAEDGTAMSISAYVGGPPPKLVRYAIYSDAGGEPDALIVESDTASMQSPSLHWMTVDITPTPLPAGTYWLALALEKSAMKCVESPPGEGQLRYRDNDAVANGFLSSWGASDFSADRQISIYGTYTSD
jgi:hypothetical protein